VIFLNCENMPSVLLEGKSSFQSGDPKNRCLKNCERLERSADFRPQLVVHKLLNAYARVLSK
jgi:hypothetical protein